MKVMKMDYMKYAKITFQTMNYLLKRVWDQIGITTLLIAISILSQTSHAQVVTYIHTDALGSPVAKSDANGNLITNSKTRYEPYGMTVAGTATPTIGFTGHVNDADTGLTYMQQRYYDPVAGRFLSEDPVLTDANSGKSFNRYVYAENNPYRYIDLDGRESGSFHTNPNLQMANPCKSASCAGQALVAMAGVYGGIAVYAGVSTLAAVPAAPVIAKMAPALAKVESAALKTETTVVRTTQSGDKAIRTTNADGSIIDISSKRVKEYVPNTHPKAPEGAMNKVKFENAQPGSKGFKRDPTKDELIKLKEATK